MHELHPPCYEVQVRDGHALLCWQVGYPVPQEDLVAPHKGPAEQERIDMEAVMST